MIIIAAIILGLGAVQQCYFVFQAAAFIFEQQWPWDTISSSVVTDAFGGFIIFVGCGILSGALYQMHHILHHGHNWENGHD